MRKNKTESRDFEIIAEREGVTTSDVKNIVNSFFDVLVSESRKLPFDTPRKIFSKAAFEKNVSVQNIPFIGRFGPSYTRYLKWRANESKGIRMVPREAARKKYTSEEIETIAEMVLKGEGYAPPERKRNNNYKRVWLVGQDKKKSARQVIPKER